VNGAASFTRYYSVINDLLGGDYYLDINTFVNNQTTVNPLANQNNIADPNKLLKVGDVVYDDYNINVNREEAWGQAEKSFEKADIFLSGTVNNTSFMRVGNMVSGLFPTSGGDSKTLEFMNYGIKGGITYKLDKHNYLTLNAAYMTKPPLPNYSFESASTRNDIVPNLGSNQVMTGDLTYQVRYGWLRGRVSYYYSVINNQVWERSYWDDVLATYVNYTMTNLDQVNQGVEIGLEATIARHWAITGTLSDGTYLYSNRPDATITADNTAQVLAQDRVIYIQNYHVGGTPETAGTIGLRYSADNYKWYAGIYLNYFANNYVTIDPDRRAAENLTTFIAADPEVSHVLNQELLPDAYTLNFRAGDRFKLKNGHTLGVNLMLNNLTNNEFKVAGYEQLRYVTSNVYEFPNKYAYSMGLTFMVSLSYLFN